MVGDLAASLHADDLDAPTPELACCRQDVRVIGLAPEGDTTAVDSGYFAALADVGVAGFVLVVLILGRLGQLAYGHARAGRREGWFALALVVALVIDALTRSSFTAFPTAFLGLLLVGVALAAARDGEPDRASTPA